MGIIFLTTAMIVLDALMAVVLLLAFSGESKRDKATTFGIGLLEVTFVGNALLLLISLGVFR